MSVVGWAEPLAGFETMLEERDRSVATTYGYMLHVRLLAEAFDCSPWDIAPSMLGAWLDDHNWSLETRRKVLVTLRLFFAYGISNQFLGRSPLVGLAEVTHKSTGPRRTTPTTQWREPVEEFLRSLQAGGRSAGTLAQRRHWLTNISMTFADPWSVTGRDLSEYLSRPDWSAEYKRGGRTSLRRFYGWALRSGLIDVDPTIDLEPVKLPRALPRPTPTDAIIEARARIDDRTRLAIDLCMFAGLRIGEAASLALDDINADTLRVHGKGSRERMVPLHDDLRVSLRAELSRRLEAGETSQWLFPNGLGGHLTSAHLAKTVSRGFEGRFKAHQLRHRFATQAYATSHDLRAVQELLGHSKPETTARYAFVPASALRAAIAGVGLS